MNHDHDHSHEHVHGPDCNHDHAPDHGAAHDWIRTQVASNDVVLFMKGNKQMPQCGFSSQVVQMLDYLGVGYKDVDVLQNMEIRDGIKSYTNWPTIPQLYVKGEFVGGCDIIREMFQAGELQQLLAEKSVQIDQNKVTV